MSLRRSVLLTVVLAALVPGTAAAQDVRVVARDVPLEAASTAARSIAARPAPVTFTMVGIHWQGSGRVWFRTAVRPGRFGPWRAARPEAEDAPDVGSDERDERAGWRIGNPWWTGPARWIQYRIAGEVTRLRSYFIDSPVTDSDRSAASRARAAAPAAAAARAGPVQPGMVRRAEWNADETIVRDAPAIAQRLRFAVVHHTAGSNSYSRAESAAIVRGIQRYHVLGNGWDDIGYNFLVDKYGKVFEGRGGGIVQNVVGAHAGGFNTGSVGVAVIGIYDSTRISRAARRALQRLLAWRLDVGHVFPRGAWDAISGGSSRWPVGAEARLRAVSGHRDTSYTSCPGGRIYGLLGAIARRVTRIGLPKLWTPEAEGGVGGFVRFTARLSEALPWRVEVRDDAGSVVASGSGNGTAVDWTWNATAVPVTSYTYTITAGPDVRPSTLPVPGPPPLAITRLRAAPKVLTPNGDGNREDTTVRFGLTRRALLGVSVENVSSGATVRTLLPSAVRSGGTRRVSWDGTNGSGAPAPDGSYRIRVFAEDRGDEATRTVRVVLDRTLGDLTATPRVVSPNGDGLADRLGVDYRLARSAAVRVQIRRDGDVLRTILDEQQPAGAHRVEWDGRVRGARLGDGTATAVVLATTSFGTRRLSRRVELDTRKPVVRVLSLRTVQGTMRLRLRLSEPGELTIWHGRRTWRDGGSFVVTRPAGESWVRRPFGARVVRIVAIDDGLNRSAAVVYRR
jgi:flagellar hook assembly protein FlgD